MGGGEEPNANGGQLARRKNADIRKPQEEIGTPNLSS